MKVWLELWSDLSRVMVHETEHLARSAVFDHLIMNPNIPSYCVLESPQDPVVKIRYICADGTQILILELVGNTPVCNFL
jgi:hypothetical protein